MGGDKKPSFEYFQGGHGKTVIAEALLTDEAIRRVLRTTREDLVDLAWGGTHGGGGAARRGRVGDAVGGVHARIGCRGDLRGDGPGSRHGRHELDGARRRPAR